MLYDKTGQIKAASHSMIFKSALMLDNILNLPVPMQFLAPSISTCGRTKDVSRHEPHTVVCNY